MTMRALPRTRAGVASRARREFLPFLIPSTVVLVVTLLYPFAETLRLSFSDYYLPNPQKAFVGLRNYAELLYDHRFWNALGKTFYLAFSSVGLQLVLGLAMALLLNRITIGRRVFTTLLLLPMAVTPVVAGLILKWMFMDQWGMVNYFLGMLGIRGPAWLGESNSALWAVSLAHTWQYTPFVCLVLLAGLQTLPEEPIEAAVVDGASSLRVLWHVVLPLLRPLILFIVVIRTMDAFLIFDLVAVMTWGGPGVATETITFFNYQIAFSMLQIGRASALGVLTLGILSVLIGSQIYSLYVKERGEW